MRVHLLVELTKRDGDEPATIRDVRQALTDHVESHTVWAGQLAEGGTPYDATVLGFEVEP